MRRCYRKMRLIKDRPKNVSGRAEKEVRVYDFLDQLNIPYEYVDHEPAQTMEDCAAVDQVLQTQMCKNLFLCNRQKTDFYLLLIRGEKKFKTKDISKQIGSARLSFASAEDMERLLDISPGAVSVLGLMNDVQGQVRLLVDEDLLSEEFFGCHPCVNTSSLKVRTKDILETFLKAVDHEMTVVKIPQSQEQGAES